MEKGCARGIAFQQTIPAKIEQIQAQIDELLPWHAEAEAAVTKAEQALASAQDDVNVARNARQTIHWTLFELRGKIENLKSQQKAHGSPFLSEFVREMTNLWLDDIRNKVRTERRAGKKDFITRRAGMIIRTNAPAVAKAVSYIRNAIDEAERLKSEPLTDYEVQTKLDELRKGIPSVEDWTEIERDPTIFLEKPTERYKASDPRDEYNS